MLAVMDNLPCNPLEKEIEFLLVIEIKDIDESQKLGFSHSTTS